MLRRLFLTLWLLLATALVPTGAQAGTASLIADRVQVLGNGQIVAEGNVVVLFEDIRLTATRVSYDQSADLLDITGPLTLIQGNDTILLADAAQLSGDMREGLMQSARLVLDQQLQIAAAEINRVQGRYTQLSKVVASSCEVCAERPVPLWQIRASRVIHDQQERQLYFHDAQFRVMDLPIFYLPRLRMPDPTLKRATGFLPPSLRTNTRLGTGVRLPYFIKLGDHADLTLTPYLSNVTSTLEARYRQLFINGGITFDGAVSQDSLLPGDTRFYLFGHGAFDLKRDFTLSFGLELVSDAGYLSDYGYSDTDRLESHVALTRARRDEYIFAGVTQYNTLRASEIPISDQLPFGQGDLFYERRFTDGILGGDGFWQFSAQGHFRASTADQLGRDMVRVGAAGEWRREWIFENGMVGEIEGAINADAYWINQDSTYDPFLAHITPSAGVTLRWPMSRATRSGALEVLEPVVQLAWTDRIGADVPNEDSPLVEFDEANLFDLSRFPGFDRYERGLRGNLGLRWSRYQPDGWTWTLAGGKVFRGNDLGQFSLASGLDGVSSDWLVAGQVQLGDQFALQGRALLSDGFDVSKAEGLVMWRDDRIALSSGYIWVMAAPGGFPGEDRTDAINEWSMDAAYNINDRWKANADWRFDIERDQVTKAGLGLQYANECVTVDLSLSRRFTSSTSVTPTTDIGLGISLTGFGGTKQAQARQCGR
ncbi:LPS assembly protein LptD [Aliiroseovarius subalbicans]|uniref:LPS-assembly protein LptD n=1 Tax=Aliiroseovarius subalbicans TaxID=2925840 RepID=UPI001F59F667|nr:LPS assembly protein LptD [Aliiroseovarius subalbicans]MCI2398162.1 LPS assembly protein LptD [Aliiroseovarius subalbicans]